MPKNNRHKIKITAVFLALTTVLGGIKANANSSNATYYERKEEGWFWYNEEPEVIPEEKKEEKRKEPVTPPPPPTAKLDETKDELQPLSVAWLRENLPNYLDKAIDNPTIENVEAYKFLERIMMDKSNRFAEVSVQAVLGNPLLDEASRRPLADFGAMEANKQSGRNTDKQLAAIAKDIGIYFFFSSTCGFCEKQAPVLEVIQKLYGFSVLPISIDGKGLRSGKYPDYIIDNGQAQKLKVYGTPTIFLAKPETNELVALGQGLMSVDNIKSRILNISLRSGWISNQQFDQTRPINNVMRTDNRAVLENNEELIPSEILSILKNSANAAQGAAKK